MITGEYRNIIKYILAGLFGLLTLTFFMDQYTIAESSASPLDVYHVIENLVQIQQDPLVDGLTDLFGQITGTTALIASLKGYITKLLVLWILSAAVPLLSGVLLLFLKGNAVPFAAGTGCFISCVIKVISWQTISAVNNITEDLIGGLIVWNRSAIAIWIILSVLIAAGIAAYLLCGRMQETVEKTYRIQENIIVDEPFRKGNSIMEKKTFYGAVIGQSGAYRDKAFPLRPGEEITIGSDAEDDIGIIGADSSASCCLIRYDLTKEEYQVEPMEKRQVFLRSGQPLGSGRTYCLPRGTEIMIIDRKNSFVLA